MSRVVELSKIRIDGGTQPREEIDQKTVDEYAEAYAALVKMPPIVVYFDGVNAWLADGFHRYHAAKKNGNQAIDADWREGTLEKAKFYAAGSNKDHGLRRKDIDKKRAIKMLLETSEGKRWAAEKGQKDSGLKAIGKHCGVSPAWVTMVLASIQTEKLPSRTEKRAAVESALTERPDATTREIAALANVSHTTVEKVRKELADRKSDTAPKPDAPEEKPRRQKTAERAEQKEAPVSEPPTEPTPIPEKPTDPLKGCASINERDAVDAWVAEGARLYGQFGDGAREYMRTAWDKRLAKLEGY